MSNFRKSRLRKFAEALTQGFGVKDIFHGEDSMTNSSPDVNELLVDDRSILRDMDSPSDRLRKARIAAGYDSPTDAARALGIPPPTYLGHENGTTKFTRKAELYAKKFNISLDYLVTGKGPKAFNARVPVIAYVGAGAEVFPVDDHPRGRGLEMVDPPAGLGSNCVAAKIKGESMHPLKSGWLVFWSKDQDGVPEECLGQLCVVQIVGGPMLLKDLRRGTRKGLYTLDSWNAPARENVQVEWASRVIDIRPS